MDAGPNRWTDRQMARGLLFGSPAWSLGSTIQHLQSILGGANHSTNSFVFSTGVALCEERFCWSPSGARLIGPCKIDRARLVWRRTCRRDSSSSSGGPKTRRTIIANTNQPLIVPLLKGCAKSPPVLLEFYKHAFRVLTHWALESAPVLAGHFSLYASEHHLGAAFWAFGTYDSRCWMGRWCIHGKPPYFRHPLKNIAPQSKGSCSVLLTMRPHPAASYGAT